MDVRRFISDENGATAVTVGVSLAMFVAFAALTIDIGYGLVAKNELHNIADAAALAGARQMGRIYVGMNYSQQQTYVMTGADRSLIEAEIADVASKNKAAGMSITINSSDIRVGTWDFRSRSLTVTDVHPSAVQVTARRDALANGPVTTFLAGIIGVTGLDVSATATASLSGPSRALPGAIDLPIGISKAWFDRQTNGPCGQFIRFNSTSDPLSCAGWHTFTTGPASNNNLRRILQGMQTGTFESPETIAGETEYNFIGGNLGTQAFLELQRLYDLKKDPVTGEWKTFVVVYDRDDCSNPNQSEAIVGFATAIVTQVKGPPEMTIDAMVYCDLVDDARGGGTYYGTLGSIPGLVQ